ncbi:MAG: hypothetical protein P8076_07000 [Gammaproteobacteria bacterium]
MPDNSESYSGPERRRGQRRKLNDRREMVRFEPDKTPRRSGKDRRSDKDIWRHRDF